MMKTIRILTDILMFISMCFLVGTGLLIHYRLVPGSRGGHGLSLLGLTRHEWGFHHLWVAYILLFLVVIHLALNFAFIRHVICRKKPWFLILLGLSGLAITFSFLFIPIEKDDDGGKKHEGRRRLITGEQNSGLSDRPHRQE